MTDLSHEGCETARPPRIFVGWSGGRSHQVAKVLESWIPLAVQMVDVWMSDDIVAGRVWSSELASGIKGSPIGILCVNPDNVLSEWLHFEAGVLASNDSLVIPFLSELREDQLSAPLRHFQVVPATRDGVRRLVHVIHERCGTTLSQSQIDEVFSAMWPRLARRLAAHKHAV